MSKVNIFLLVWCSFFFVFDVSCMIAYGVTSNHLFGAGIQAVLLCFVWSEDKVYIKSKFKDWFYIVKRIALRR